MHKTDKRDRAKLFRDRLLQAMGDVKETQSGLARRVGVDRSTISQLLSKGGARLPNAQVVAECASALGVSSDWLLGLSERPESAADLLATAMEITAAPRALIDAQIFDWHIEAAGYKIRHVPAGLPDMMKTREVLQWEYEPSLGKTTDQAIGASEDRLNLMQEAKSDFEIALPLHDVQAFARGEGYYAGLDAGARRAQLDRMITLHEALYPSLRVSLFDARRLYSAPITVFGPMLAVIYLGQNYLAFRDTERVQAFTRHFDGLVREAEVTERDFPARLQALKAAI